MAPLASRCPEEHSLGQSLLCSLILHVQRALTLDPQDVCILASVPMALPRSLSKPGLWPNWEGSEATASSLYLSHASREGIWVAGGPLL